MKRYPFLRVRVTAPDNDAHEHFVVIGMMLKELGSALDGFEESERAANSGEPLNLEPQGAAIRGLLQDRAYWSARKIGYARNVVFAVFEIGAIVERLAKRDARFQPARELFQVVFPNIREVRNSLMHLHERAFWPMPEERFRSGHDDVFPSITDQASAWGVALSDAISIRIEADHSAGGRTIRFPISQEVLDGVERVLSEVASSVDEPDGHLRKF